MNGDGLTAAAASTFIAVLEDYSDAGVCRESVNVVKKNTTITTTGDNLVDLRGTVLLEEVAGDLKVSITIPAIKQTAIDPADGKLTAACVAAVKSAFETLTGKTMTYIDSFVYDKVR